MPGSSLEYLFNSYIKNNYTPEQAQELMSSLAKAENKEAVKKLIDAVIENTRPEKQMTNEAAASILQNILSSEKGKVAQIKKRNIGFRYWRRAAAVIILFLGGASAYLIFNKKEVKKVQAVVSTKKDAHIRPGGNRAILTMSDGRTIILDSIQNGTVIQKGGVKISKQGGLLIYKVPTFTEQERNGTYNTLSTPRGGQYQVILPDGSKVWLNAASSLHFPTVFSGSRRSVELIGEAYFEVAKNKAMPFTVKVGAMQVSVLGTHFNINAYPDEDNIKTSLLEGSVKITKGKTSGTLRAGQQARMGNEKDRLEITKPNMNEVMAWKNGLFQFEGADIITIMRQIGRWYNVEIAYAGKIPMRQFQGKISRNVPLQYVLRILELNNVKFTVVGNQIIVE
ncbi:MAG: FecR domain-containing protein [Ginsengibacter sp.]